MPIPSPTATAVTVHTHPDLTRPDAGIVAVSEFQVGGADQQQALFEASRAAWDSLPWPETLLSIAWLASLDGQSALAYVQWRDESEFEAYGRTHRPMPRRPPEGRHAHAGAGGPRCSIAAIAVAPAPTRPSPAASSRCRSSSTSPDEARQRAWVDAVFDALASEPEPPAGGIGAHFHVSTDGTRVLNYAEWVDAASHVAALERSGIGAVGSGPKWRAVQTFPGLKASRVTRYRLDRRLVPASAAGVSA